MPLCCTILHCAAKKWCTVNLANNRHQPCMRKNGVIRELFIIVTLRVCSQVTTRSEDSDDIHEFHVCCTRDRYSKGKQQPSACLSRKQFHLHQTHSLADLTHQQQHDSKLYILTNSFPPYSAAVCTTIGLISSFHS